MTDDTAYPAKTTRPSWPPLPEALCQEAMNYTLFSLGKTDGLALNRWKHELAEAAVSYDVVTVPPDALLDWVKEASAAIELLASNRLVGWRIAAAGEEVAVLALCSAARQVGLIDPEMVVFVESSERIMVYCPHCKSRTIDSARPGSAIFCSGCFLQLEVHPHLSHHLGMYLGTDKAARDRRRVRTNHESPKYEAAHG